MAKVTKPRCSVCGTQHGVHWTPEPGQIPGAHGAHRWLCGDCEYRRDAPDAKTLSPPARKPARPQADALW